MKSKIRDEVAVIRISFEGGKLRTFIYEREWRFPRLMKILEFHDYFLFNNYQLDFLIKDKRIIAVVFPDSLIQKRSIGNLISSN
jgi:hypothetical protein